MNAAQHLLIYCVRLYRWFISPAKAFLFGPLGRCRFTPSCSQYAIEAIQIHGASRGSWLALKRLLRCHPWGGCGEDHVPPIGRGGRSAAVPAAAATIVDVPARVIGCPTTSGRAAAGTAALRTKVPCC